MAPDNSPLTLELVRGKELLGTIDVKPGGADLPWHTGAFHPTAHYESVRALFERELKLLRANTEDDESQWEDWEAVNEELHAPGLRLQSKDKSFVADEIVIHISDAEAWWRREGDQ